MTADDLVGRREESKVEMSAEEQAIEKTEVGWFKARVTGNLEQCKAAGII